MAELFGYAGKMLRVDLTTGESTEFPSEKYVEKYLGGRELVAALYWDEIAPEVQPFDPENKLIFAPGPASATGAIACGKCECATKSPGYWPYSTFLTGTASYIGPAMKQAGYDALIIQGKAKVPSYIYINDGKVEIRDAQDLWGMTTRQTREELLGRLGVKNTVVSIGPAGEKLDIHATISIDNGSVFARGGPGSVMGSKNLKAMVLYGTNRIKVADPQGLLKANEKRMRLFNIKVGEERELEGGRKIVGKAFPAGTAPGSAIFPGTVLESEGKRGNMEAKLSGCTNCAYFCKSAYKFKDGSLPAGMWKCEGPLNWSEGDKEATGEYIGRLSWYAGQLIDDMGFDNECVGSSTNGFGLEHHASNRKYPNPDDGYTIWWHAYQMFFSGYEAGIFTKENTGMLFDEFGSAKFLETWIDLMLEKKGVMGAYADHGVRGVVEYVLPREEFGPNRELLVYFYHRMSAKLGFGPNTESRHGPYSPNPMRMLYSAVGDQLGSEPEPYWTWGYPDVQPPSFPGVEPMPRNVIEKWLGTDKVTDMFYWGPEVASAVIAHENIAIVEDSMEMCDMHSYTNYPIAWGFNSRDPKPIVDWSEFLTNTPHGGPEYLSAIFGREVTLDELNEQAERSLNLIRAIWVRDGYTAGGPGTYDTFWDEVFDEKDEKGRITTPKDKFEALLQEYYKQRGWKDGCPTRETLERLGLSDVADDLARRNLLPI